MSDHNFEQIVRDTLSGKSHLDAWSAGRPMSTHLKCDACGKPTPIKKLDGKPQPTERRWQRLLKVHGGFWR